MSVNFPEDNTDNNNPKPSRRYSVDDSNLDTEVITQILEDTRAKLRKKEKYHRRATTNVQLDPSVQLQKALEKVSEREEQLLQSIDIGQKLLDENNSLREQIESIERKSEEKEKEILESKEEEKHILEEERDSVNEAYKRTEQKRIELRNQIQVDQIEHAEEKECLQDYIEKLEQQNTQLQRELEEYRQLVQQATADSDSPKVGSKESSSKVRTLHTRTESSIEEAQLMHTRIASLEGELEEQKKMNGKLREKLDILRSERSEFERKLAILETEKEDQVSSMKQYQQEMVQMKQALHHTSQENERLKEEIEHLRQNELIVPRLREEIKRLQRCCHEEEENCNRLKQELDQMYNRDSDEGKENCDGWCWLRAIFKCVCGLFTSGGSERSVDNDGQPEQRERDRSKVLQDESQRLINRQNGQ